MVGNSYIMGGKKERGTEKGGEGGGRDVGGTVG